VFCVFVVKIILTAEDTENAEEAQSLLKFMASDLVEREKNAETSGFSDVISEFYNAHPYPPPVENLDRARDLWQDPNRRKAEYHLLWPKKSYRSDLDVLIAGCGTWQAAKFALCHPDARVIGIDVSAKSLDHTEQLKHKYNLTNLITRQLPIEKVDELDRDFDLIVCTGVLHHLADPDAGLRALRSVLKPDGAIYLMMYAPYGRAGVYMIQEYCRRLGIGTSRKEIEDLVAFVKALSPHHPLSASLRAARDTSNADALADALLNPRDRAYSVPRLFDFIERNDLMFARWYWQAPYLPQCGSITTTAHASSFAALPAHDQYAAMELFRGTMTSHSVVVYRNDAKAPDRVSFIDESWQRYVPVRLPWTMCVQERLPKGAAGVLLNQSHPFHDLILVIDAEEKGMFDLIDGLRSIAQIVNQSGGNTSRARFWEKLWWYDQVVFDTTK
jgi:SAM-dependent methyltransferase